MTYLSSRMRDAVSHQRLPGWPHRGESGTGAVLGMSPGHGRRKKTWVARFWGDSRLQFFCVKAASKNRPNPGSQMAPHGVDVRSPCDQGARRCFSAPRAPETLTIVRWSKPRKVCRSMQSLEGTNMTSPIGRCLRDLSEILPRPQVTEATSANSTKLVELAEVA